MSNKNNSQPEAPYVIAFLLTFISIVLAVKSCSKKPVSYDDYDDYNDEDTQQLPYSAP